MFKLAVGFCAVVAIGLAIGCGSGADQVTSGARTKAQFIKEADAICARYSRQIKADFAAWEKKFPGGNSGAHYALDEAVDEVVVPSLRQQVKELNRLSPPTEDKPETNEMIESLSKTADDLASRGVRGLRGSRFVDDFEHAAKAYGLKICPNL